MSKATRAFSFNSTERFAGRNPYPVKSAKTPEVRLPAHYNGNVWSKLESFPTPPNLLPIRMYYPDFEGLAYSGEFTLKLANFYNNELKPWAEDNDISKYRLFNIMIPTGTNKRSPYTFYGEYQRAPNDNPLPDTYLETTWGSEYYAAGITFKDPKHYLLFKLRF